MNHIRFSVLFVCALTFFCYLQQSTVCGIPGFTKAIAQSLAEMACRRSLAQNLSLKHMEASVQENQLKPKNATWRIAQVMLHNNF